MNPKGPIIGITMGDAAGIGPEVIAKALDRPEVYGLCRPVVIGDAKRMQKAAQIAKVSAKVKTVAGPSEAGFRHGTIDTIDVGGIPEDLPFGKLSPVAGDGAYRFIAKAVELAKAGKIHAICTAPLNKEALHAGGHAFPGHTEMLAKLAGTKEVSMMLATPKMRVIHVTTHIGLIDAIAKIEPGLVERTIRRGNDALVRSGVARPRIGLCGINPHAGTTDLVEDDGTATSSSLPGAPCAARRARPSRGSRALPDVAARACSRAPPSARDGGPACSKARSSAGPRPSACRNGRRRPRARARPGTRDRAAPSRRRAGCRAARATRGRREGDRVAFAGSVRSPPALRPARRSCNDSQRESDQ